MASDLAPYPKKTMSGFGCSNSNSTKAFSSTAKVSFIFHCTGKSLSEALLFVEHGGEQVVYKNCSECQKQLLYTRGSPKV